MLDALLEGEIEDPDLLECYFLEALYCSLGASLLEDGRIKFDECIKDQGKHDRTFGAIVVRERELSKAHPISGGPQCLDRDRGLPWLWTLCKMTVTM